MQPYLLSLPLLVALPLSSCRTLEALDLGDEAQPASIGTGDIQAEPPLETADSETEPNDDADQANTAHVGRAIAGAVGSPQDAIGDWFRFQTAAEGEAWVVLTNTLPEDGKGEISGVILNPAKKELARLDLCGPGHSVRTDRFRAEPGVAYLILVRPRGSGLRTPYLLEVQQPPKTAP